ncbi:MAG: hypothetical protein ACP5F3_06950 [Candidatus Syntrophosphaera sp.]
MAPGNSHIAHDKGEKLNANGYLKGMLAGAISGIVVLGVLFRLITIAIAILSNDGINISFRNIVEVLIAGSLIGIIGGILLALLMKIFKSGGWPLIILDSALLFILTLVMSLALNPSWLDLTGSQPALLLTTAIIFLLYGIFMMKLYRQLNKRENG